ncbi:MAG: UDP-N-acetylglucosamine--N-acetylmuramyl-(pentapeptide) pyrophosphoryl-undecaprenol N-acetylglucosamine transferase [Gemmatimonadaceae bacterium]|nr:UDP-N-acetylglucosamine--N-acetylmuramyl-(pentapeptide) pyrophosphoryl-undecaprenol N-acetylglucosamine transferase [Gemmatimonadaceae bacterium]
MRVFFAGGGTGGHLYPALAVARALVRQAPSVRPHFLGSTRGIERHILPNAEFPYTLLDLHPLYRTTPWRNWRTVRGLWSAHAAIGDLMRADPARLTFATGGYASAAGLLYSRLHGLPYVLHEANSFPGMTVRWFSASARELYLGFPEATASLPAAARARAVDTGNPIEPPPQPTSFSPSRAERLRAWELDASTFVLLVFGGSQGSAAINRLIDSWLVRGLPAGLSLIWATGREQFAMYAPRASGRVVVRDYLAPIADAYAVADLALTRAGAMTTAELCAWGVPMILIPLPTAAGDHQTANARALEACGAARWIAQSDASDVRLDGMVRELIEDRGALERLGAGARARARPDSARQIAERVHRLIDA